MATRADADAFREFWKMERLLDYRGKWVAFRDNEVLATANRLPELLEIFRGDIERKESPIFAFVQIGILQ